MFHFHLLEPQKQKLLEDAAQVSMFNGKLAYTADWWDWALIFTARVCIGKVIVLNNVAFISA